MCLGHQVTKRHKTIYIQDNVLSIIIDSPLLLIGMNTGNGLLIALMLTQDCDFDEDLDVQHMCDLEEGYRQMNSNTVNMVPSLRHMDGTQSSRSISMACMQRMPAVICGPWDTSSAGSLWYRPTIFLTARCEGKPARFCSGSPPSIRAMCHSFV